MINFSSMTPRERLLAVINNKEADRIPCSPFLAYWWENQPQSLQKNGQFEFLKSIGADPLLRGLVNAVQCSDIQGLNEQAYDFHNRFEGDVRIERSINGNTEECIFNTPKGSLTMQTVFSSPGNTRYLTEHPVKEVEDYEILNYIMESAILDTNINKVSTELDTVGEGGLSLFLFSPFKKTAFQALLEHYVGTEQLVYDLYDYPEVVEETLRIMQKLNMKALEIALETGADGFISWEDTSTGNISPDLFRKYIKPEIKNWTTEMHRVGKVYVHHACGLIKGLLEEMVEEGADAIESITPPPTGDVYIYEAQELTEGQMSFIGGIDPVEYYKLNNDDFRKKMLITLEKTSALGFVLANADSCPPEVSRARLIQTVNVLKEFQGLDQQISEK